MTNMKNVRKSAITGAVGISIASGAVMMIMSVLAVFQNAYCEMHGYSPEQFSLVISVLSGGGIIVGLFIGKLIPKFGIKRLTIIASFAPLAAAAGLYFCSSLIVTYAIALFCGMLVGLATPAVMNMYIGSWFGKGSGTMVSMGQIISKVWEIVFIPVATNMLVFMGKESVPLFGAIMTAIALVGALLMKGMPADYGVERVDLVEKEKKKSGGTTSEEIYDVKMPATRLALKFPAFCFLIMTFLGIVSMVMTSTYGVYMYDSYINDMVTASYFVSIRTAVSMVLSFLFGILCDKLGLRASVLIYGLLCAASSFIGPVIGGTAGALILACFNGTMAYTTMFIGVGLPLVVGYKNMPAFAGWAGSLMSVGGMIAPPLAMALVSANGGAYDLLNYVSGALILVATLACLYSISKKGRANIKAADEKWQARESGR